MIMKGVISMKRIVLSAAALSLLSGLAMTAPADAASYKRHSNITPRERVTIVHSKYKLNALKHRVRSNGHVSLWERVRVRKAQARHRALVRRLRHN
jgi:hypothetical protein